MKEHKLIFIAMGTSWCGPCKQMEKTVFTNDTVADYYNAHFLNLKLDLEKGEGIAIGDRFNITSVPVYLFLDSAGNLVYKMKSAMSAGKFLAHGKRANDPEKNLLYYQNNFTTHQNNIRFVEDYLEILGIAGMTSPEALRAYLSLQKDSLVSQKNWNILKSHVKDIYSEEFAYMVANRKAYAEKVPPEEVMETLDSRISKEFERLVFNTDTFNMEAFNKAKDYVSSLHYEQGDKLIFEAGLNAAEQTANWNEYAALALQKAEYFYLDSAGYLTPLSIIAYKINEHFPPGQLLDKAEFWAKTDAGRQPGYFSDLAYAQILHRNNKTDEALKAALLAKKYATEMNVKDCIDTANALIKEISKKKYQAKN